MKKKTVAELIAELKGADTNKTPQKLRAGRRNAVEEKHSRQNGKKQKNEIVDNIFTEMIKQPKLKVLAACANCVNKCKISAIPNAELICCKDYSPIDR